MSLKEDTSKDTHIKLILQDVGPRQNAVVVPDDSLYHEIDLTEQIIDALQGFSLDCVLGIDYQVEGSPAGQLLCYKKWELVDRICRAIGGILDAVIVNEKQRKALDLLVYSKISDTIDIEAKGLDYALKALKK